MPAVEILQIGNPAAPPNLIPRAALGGWLGETELLVVRNGRLTVRDARGNPKSTTLIRVRTAADVSLRQACRFDAYLRPRTRAVTSDTMSSSPE
jgi:hypothetical protein